MALRFDGMHNGINHIAGKLRRQYAEIIGEYYKKDTEQKMPSVFPEIFIERRKMLHSLQK